MISKKAKDHNNAIHMGAQTADINAFLLSPLEISSILKNKILRTRNRLTTDGIRDTYVIDCFSDALISVS